MRFSSTVRIALLLLIITPSLAHAQTDKRQLLETVTPTISRSAEQLNASSAEILRSADRGSQKQPCPTNRELVTLGTALQGASESLRLLEPMLLEKERVDLSVLLNRDLNSPANRPLFQNMRRIVAYDGSLKNIAEAGQELTSLDPISNQGPTEKVAQLLKTAGQSLITLNENSGIGVHFKNMGEAMERLRLARLRNDKRACAEATRFLGHIVKLVGETLAGATCALLQSSATLDLSSALYSLSEQLSPRAFDMTDQALDRYETSLLQHAATLSRREATARTVRPPRDFPRELDQFQAAASAFATGAEVATALAAHINQARKLLRIPKTGAPSQKLASAMQAAGSELREFGTFGALVETGRALFQAGVRLENQQLLYAAERLKEAAEKIFNYEKPLVLPPR